MEIERVKERVMEGRPGFTRDYGPQRADHQPGIPFWPQEIYRDLVVILLLVAITFFLSAYVTPFLGPARSPQLSEIIVPDWYLLFSWGLLKVADIFPQFTLGPAEFNPQFWGDILSGIPIIALLLLPFLDRGRESRPAKAPVRSAVGLAGIVSIFTASFYSIREIVWEVWRVDTVPGPGEAYAFFLPDGALKLFFVVPPVLVGLSSYVGLRRLGFRPMRAWLVPLVAGAFAIAAAHALAILFVPGWLPAHLAPYRMAIAVVYALLLVPAGAAAVAVTVLPETSARKAVTAAGIGALAALLAAYAYLELAAPTTLPWVLLGVFPEMNTIVFLPGFAVVTAWFGLRRPYSTYEYLLNECYQCGKCHTVCPVTKVEDDALGGLNLVYNSFKKQHDGVPLWTCLACDACSAVCPLDIKYSDYILEERSRNAGRMAADGGRRT